MTTVEAWNDFGVPVETIQPELYAAAGLSVVDKRPKLVSVDDIKAEEDTSALEALKAEAAKAAMVPFVYDGETYLIPKADDWDLEVMEAFEENRVVFAAKSLLGPEQWARFTAKKRKAVELNALFEGAYKSMGLKRG